MDDQPLLFELPPPETVMRPDELRCPFCNAPMTEGANFGNECGQRPPRLDLFGQPIFSLRFGNCHSCWKMVQLVNGRLAQVAFAIPPMNKDAE